VDVANHSVTLIAIIVGLGLTELLLNLHKLIRARERVVWYALPFVWTAVVLLLLLNYWWALVLGRDGSQMAHTAAQFGLLLIHPLLMFLMCASVLPQAPAEGLDMREAYGKERLVLVWLFVLYMMGNWTLALLINPHVVWDLATVLRAIASAFVISLLFVKDRRWDWIAAAGVLIAVIWRLGIQTVR
jgi:hypothetical protein